MAFYRVRSTSTPSSMASGINDPNRPVSLESAAQYLIFSHTVPLSISTRVRFGFPIGRHTPRTRPISLVSDIVGQWFSAGREKENGLQLLRTPGIVPHIREWGPSPRTEFSPHVVHAHREGLLREITVMYTIPGGRIPRNQRYDVHSDRRTGIVVRVDHWKVD